MTLLCVLGWFINCNGVIIIYSPRFYIYSPFYETRGGSRTAAASKMEHFVIIVNGFQPLTIITKRSILDFEAGLHPPLETCHYKNYGKLEIQIIFWNSHFSYFFSYALTHLWPMFTFYSFWKFHIIKVRFRGYTIGTFFRNTLVFFQGQVNRYHSKSKQHWSNETQSIVFHLS